MLRSVSVIHHSDGASGISKLSDGRWVLWSEENNPDQIDIISNGEKTRIQSTPGDPVVKAINDLPEPEHERDMTLAEEAMFNTIRNN